MVVKVVKKLKIFYCLRHSLVMVCIFMCVRSKILCVHFV
jgi:hypothetical protein